jgi:hypothetical protein
MSIVHQLFGNLSLRASLPPFFVYYLFYSSFEYDDPEGRFTDTKVNIHFIVTKRML